MTFLLFPHLLRPDALRFTREMASFLTERGQNVCVLPEYQDALSLPLFDGNADMAIVIGGDGTVLRSVRMLPDPAMPVWAVNFGHVGYLTDCDPAGAFDALQSILSGSYSVETRSMLSGTVAEQGKESKHFLALNEAVIHRSSLSRALRLRLSVSGRFVQTIPADGILIATATGSTAYNLSSGGPILMPESDNLAVTPICPQMLCGTSLVVSGTDVVGICVSLPEESEESETKNVPLLVVDGCDTFSLCDGAEITVARASRTLRLVRTQGDSFYRTLQQKLAKTI